MIAQNIEKLRRRVEEVCRRSGRDPAGVAVLAVSKTFGVEQIEEALAAGITDFGENYVQELREKIGRMAGKPVRWHFIGHLQSNKVKYIVDAVHLIHSVDSLKLARELEKRSAKPVDVLVEVHTTSEPSKTGVQPGEAAELIREIATLTNVRVRGLMTMGPFSDDPEDSRPSFRTLRELATEIGAARIPNVAMEQLSMGMTHDFEIAIEEGATIVRIGTAIFGERRLG